jgi:integrase
MRDQGQGHIRQRGQRSFELKFDLGRDPLTGKRRVRYVSFKGTKRAAQLELARLISENAAGGSVDPSKVTLAEFIERWLRDWAQAHVSAKTFERYRELLRNHVCARIGHAQLQKLRAVHINELYTDLLRPRVSGGAGLAARTVGHVHRALHRALGHANDWDLVQKNVASLVSPPRVAANEIETLTAAQVQQALAKLKGRAIYPIAALALATGMRRGELLALRWSDVKFDLAKLNVEQSLEQTKAGLRFKSPKTKHGRREITLPTSAVTLLREHRKAQQETRLRLGLGKAPDNALVFATWDGNARSPNALTKEWSVAMKEAGLSVTFHSLRHTHASHLIASGLDVLAISRRMGHGSPAITLGVYGHLMPRSDERAAQIIEMALAPKGTE